MIPHNNQGADGVRSFAGGCARRIAAGDILRRVRYSNLEADKLLALAWEARENWFRCGLDEAAAVLVLPHPDMGFAQMCIKALHTKVHAFVVVTTLPGLESGAYRTIIADDNAIQGFIQLYSLYEFTGKLIIGSFDLPYGRKLRNLLESGVATEETLIRDVLMGALHGKDA